MMPECVIIDPVTRYPVYIKDPSAELPYGRDFTAWLQGSGIDQTNSGVTGPSDPDAPVMGVKHFLPLGSVGVWLSGGAPSLDPANPNEWLYVVRIVTLDPQPRTDERSFIIRMKER